MKDQISIGDMKKSSLQNIDFSQYSKEKVIEKYEEILIQREKQLYELSYELGILNEKNAKVNFINKFMKRIMIGSHS